MSDRDLQKTCFIFLFIVIIIFTLGGCRREDRTWIRQFGTDEEEFAKAVATDSSDNIYVAGNTAGNLDGNKSAGHWDAFLAKYSSQGGKIWIKQFGTSNDDEVGSVAIDFSENIYIAGSTYGIDKSTGLGHWDGFLVKYNSQGDKIWTRQLSTKKSDNIYAVATDSSENIYVAGTTLGSLDGNTNSGLGDAFLAKFNPAGRKLWVKQFGLSSDDGVWSVATDSSENIYVAGTTLGSINGNTNTGGFGAFIAKFNLQGDRLWIKQFGAEDASYKAKAVAVDSKGSIYVAGENSTKLDAFLAKFNSSGKKLWVKQFGSKEYDSTEAIAIDLSGNIYVAGTTLGSLDGNTNAGPGGSEDAFLVKFDSSGNKLQADQFGSRGDDQAWSVATDSSGNIYVAGTTYGEFVKNSNPGRSDILLIKNIKNIKGSQDDKLDIGH